jgi:hypothetical protein
MEGSILKWGKMRIFIATESYGAKGAWKSVPTPAQSSFALNTEEGDKLEAFVEGGDRIDVRKDANKYAFEFQVHIGAGLEKIIEDDDGAIAGNYAICVIPENRKLAGFLMDRTSVSVTESFTSEEGHRVTYTFEALKPATGKMLKSFFVLEASPIELEFPSAADTTGKTITAVTTGTLTAVSDQSWATVTVAGKVATVKVTANAGEARKACITLTADGKQEMITVAQAAA